MKFCDERGLSIDRDRLSRLERLGLFAPVFRVRDPDEKVPAFSIPIRSGGRNWFETGWAWDTTKVGAYQRIPDPADRTQEAYYSTFQIDHLHVVLSVLTLNLPLDIYLAAMGNRDVNWEENGQRWLQYADQVAVSLRQHEHRRSKALLCQYISARYYPQTQGDMRTIRQSNGHYSDRWIYMQTPYSDWHEYVRSWDPHTTERLFQLTPEKLRNAYEGLAMSQADCDPLERWYQLVQFISLRERERLKGDALRAETLRSGAQMLRLLHKDLYKEELPHPNEVTGIVITHIPELEVRRDVRRYLEFVVNRFGLNPRPKLALIVEGKSEEVAVRRIFERYFGAHPGQYAIEIIVLGGVDNATGNKEDRFRAILRLIDYLHHQQTLAFLILDDERYARKLKHASKEAKSIHHGGRYVTRAEYVRIWRSTFEFENFSCDEIASVLTEMAPRGVQFARSEVAHCKKSSAPGACLKQLYQQKARRELKKLELAEGLVDRMLSGNTQRGIGNRPFIRILTRVARLAALNPFPVMQEIWERNQVSKYLGKKRSKKSSRAGHTRESRVKKGG